MKSIKWIVTGLFLICTVTLQAQDMELRGSRFVEIGEKMPDNYIADTTDQKFLLADYLEKHILLDFWRANCPPCVRALPELKDISEKYKDKLTVISIYKAFDAKELEKAMKGKSITWPSTYDLEETFGLFSRYMVTGIPHFFLISPKGIVLDGWNGYGKERSIEKRIEQFLKE